MLTAAGTPLLAFLLLPILALLLKTSPQTVAHYLAERNTLQAIGLSLTTSTITATGVGVFGTPLAYLLARRRFHGRT